MVFTRHPWIFGDLEGTLKNSLFGIFQLAKSSFYFIFQVLVILSADGTSLFRTGTLHFSRCPESARTDAKPPRQLYLVIKYQQKVANLVSRYIRDPVEVMDVAQDAFLKAYRALSGFRGENAFYTKLYHIAINTVKNRLVAQSHRPPGDDVEVAEQMDLGTPA